MSAQRAPAATPARQPGRAATSAFVGSAVEYFDFTLFATASALFLGPVFFKPLGPAAGTMAALVTFGLAFVARPIGAILFGHLGDKKGRRHSLIASLALMGVATFLIGCLPGYASIGIAAPILLVLLRLLQGLSAGGEQAGANSLSLEHAPNGRRGFYASWTMQGTSLGTLIGKIAFLAIVSLPKEDLLSWGWRVPFLLAGPLTLVAWYIRTRVNEPGVFKPEQAPRVPVGEVLAKHPRSVVLVAMTSLVALGGAALNVYGLAFATGAKAMSAQTYLRVLIGVTIASMIVQPLWGMASDKWGRRHVFGGCALAAAVLVVGFLASIKSGSMPMFIAATLAYTLAWSGANAVGASLFGEQFPTRVRFTGTALSTQIGMMLVGFGPTIMMSLGKPGAPDGWLRPGLFAAALLACAGVAALAMRETADQPIEKLAVRPVDETRLAHA